jgi:tetratricopeptide (TPR) repeat protein
MEGVEEEDANKLRHWCEVRSLRDDIEKFPKDGKPSDLGVLFDDLGDLLDDMGDKIGSEKAYREGTRRAPACALCYYSLASALRGRNDLAGAERVLRKGIANSTEGGADPDIYLLYSDLGAQLEDKGDKRGAELVYRAAFQVIPNFASEYAEWLEVEDDSYDKRPLEEKYPSLQKLVVSLSSRS